MYLEVWSTASKVEECGAVLTHNVHLAKSSQWAYTTQTSEEEDGESRELGGTERGKGQP